MLLYPDTSKQQHYADEFVFAAPCTHEEFKKLWDKRESKMENYCHYVKTKDVDEEICIILREDQDNDDDCLATAAYLRMVKRFTGMVYALSPSRQPVDYSLASIIARTAGVSPSKVRQIEV